MGAGPRSRVGYVVVAACLAVAVICASRAAPAPGASQCASLGAAEDFGVFSNGAFNSSSSSGTSITGRVAAAGDVTLGSISVTPAAGDATPTIVAGGNFTGGGGGGTVNGGVRYGGTRDVAQNFTVNGGLTKAAPPFSFADEFVSLKNESSTLADRAQSAGATVVTSYGQLQLTGTDAGLNVFTVDAAQLVQAQGVVINLTQPGATALINVATDTQLSIAAMQYMNLSMGVSPADVLWNFSLATELAVTRGVAWQGTILAPNATVTTAGHPQLHGQLIAATVPSSDWVVDRVTFTGCLPEPPTPPDNTLTLTPLCIDSAGKLDMRLRNTGDKNRAVIWNDLAGAAFGQFVVPAHSDQFFVVPGGKGTSVIRAVSGATTVQANGTDARCTGQITVQLATVGPAPAGQTWSVRVTDGDNGKVSVPLTLAAGESGTVTVPGGYVPGTAPIDGVVGGVLYTVSVDDPHGAAETAISLNPIEILNGRQNEFVLVALAYGTATVRELPPPIEAPPPEQPTLPPQAPDPPPGPGLVAGPAAPVPGPSAPVPGPSATDLAISQQITPAKVRVGGIVRTVTVVRNLGDQAAVGAVAREIPHFRPSQPNAVADVLSLTTNAGTCTHRRPVRCTLGTLAPGATVTIRTRTRILVAARLTSTLIVSSQTHETNTTNNTASAVVSAKVPTPSIQAGISAPRTGHVATGLSYQVSVRVGVRTDANFVRLCTRPPSGLVQVTAPGTFRFRGLYCRDFGLVRAGGLVSFRVYGFPSRTGPLLASARATAVGEDRPSRAFAPIDVAGPAACPAASLTRRGGSDLPAHAAC